MSTTTQFRTTKVKMLKEWTPVQFEAINTAIAMHFRSRFNINYVNGQGKHTTNVFNASFETIDGLLGLAYTSSGIYACYGVCNVRALFDADGIYSYDYFTIGADGEYYAILQDQDENELCILL
jgi:hypothetical protein